MISFWTIVQLDNEMLSFPMEPAIVRFFASKVIEVERQGSKIVKQRGMSNRKILERERVCARSADNRKIQTDPAIAP